MFPLEKCCYVLPLKRGMLILGIIDILLIVGATTGLACVFAWDTVEIVVSTIFPLIHLVGVIFLFVSICKLKKRLVIAYVITGIVYMLDIVHYIVYGFIDAHIIYSVLLIGIVILRIYFWICVFSWYMELKNS